MAFDGTSVDTLVIPGSGATKGIVGPGVVDGEGPGAVGWATVAFVVAGGASLPLIVAPIATSSTSSDGGISILGGSHVVPSLVVALLLGPRAGVWASL